MDDVSGFYCGDSERQVDSSMGFSHTTGKFNSAQQTPTRVHTQVLSVIQFVCVYFLAK